jgi:membrane fusion protein, multidrug efflux system
LAGAALVGLGFGYQHLAARRASADASSQQAGAKASLGYAAAVSGEVGAGTEKAAWESVPVEAVRRSTTLRVTGTLQAYDKSEVASNASGIAAAVHVDRGSIVKKGDPMVQIDPEDAKNKLADGELLVEELGARLGLDGSPDSAFDPKKQPEVRLVYLACELAQNNIKRITDLHDKKVISEENFDQAKTELAATVHRYEQALHQVKQLYNSYQTAKQRVKILKKAVDDTTIVAPFDGWVVQKNIAVGEQISAGMQATKVITLVRIDRLRLALTVPQQSIGSIQPKQKVLFQVDSHPGRTFEGAVEFITPVVTNDTRTLIVEAVVENPDRALRPGLFATAELSLPEQQTSFYVPAGAVQRIGEAARVFVVRDGAAHEQIVSLGEEAQNRVEVRTGLKGGERVVAQPEKVRDGERVR